MITTSTTLCLVRGKIHHGCLFDGVWGGLQTCGDTPPEDNGRSGNSNTYFLFLHSKVAKSGAFFHTEATRHTRPGRFLKDICKGNSVLTVTPEKDLARKLDQAARGLWGLGVGFLSAILQWLSFADYWGCTDVCDRGHSISRRPTVHSYDTCTKTHKTDCTLSSQILCKG